MSKCFYTEEEYVDYAISKNPDQERLKIKRNKRKGDSLVIATKAILMKQLPKEKIVKANVAKRNRRGRFDGDRDLVISTRRRSSLFGLMDVVVEVKNWSSCRYLNYETDVKSRLEFLSVMKKKKRKFKKLKLALLLFGVKVSQKVLEKLKRRGIRVFMCPETFEMDSGESWDRLEAIMQEFVEWLEEKHADVSDGEFQHLVMNISNRLVEDGVLSMIFAVDKKSKQLFILEEGDPGVLLGIT